jgi:PAS domain S-box-containing protein
MRYTVNVNNYLDYIVHHSRDFIMLIDKNLRYVFVNKAYEKIIGKEVQEIIGKSVVEIWGMERFKKVMQKPLVDCFNGKETHYVSETPFGPEFKVIEFRFFPYREYEGGPVTHALVFKHDISRLSDLEWRLMTYEFRDQETGLFNRQSMNIILDREIQKSQILKDERPWGLFLIVIENLSEIRRLRSTDIATLILENSGLRLQAFLGKSTTIFRSEADELSALVMDLKSESDAAFLAESILSQLSTPYGSGVFEVRPQCRIGIALYPRHAASSAELIMRSQAAINSARQESASYVLYDLELHAQAVEKLRMLDSLRKSIYDNSFELYYQPIVDGNGKIEGAEALLRWHHPELGLLSPDRFLPIAEEHGVTRELEKKTLFSAARQLAEWTSYGVYISVNISASLFEDPALIELLDSAMNQAGITNPAQLRLEITESESLRNTAKAISRMQEFKERGYLIYIDDFGTGQSSMEYLKKLPAEVLKVDRAFVEGIEKNSQDRKFLSLIVELGRLRNFQIVIEGIENIDQFHIIQKMQVNSYQGFYFSKPVIAKTFEEMLKKNIQLPA